MNHSTPPPFFFLALAKSLLLSSDQLKQHRYPRAEFARCKVVLLHSDPVPGGYPVNSAPSDNQQDCGWHLNIETVKPELFSVVAQTSK